MLPPSRSPMNRRPISRLRDPAETAHWTEALGGTSLAPGHVRVPRQKELGPLTTWPGFAEGAWWVQDLAASLPARLLGAQPGEIGARHVRGARRQDAATGGDGRRGHRRSMSPRPRLDRVRENLDRTGLSAHLAAGDALRWEPGRLFDRILLDAPCSATGIFRRHPDVLHLKGSRDLTPLTLLQAALLRRAATWLKPGGTLVYATCSLDPREGERIAERIIAGLRARAVHRR